MADGVSTPAWPTPGTRSSTAEIVPGPLDLTPTEERVAALVAEGRTNREAADALFMSVNTIEWNLSRIYRKLGVRSRTDLAAKLRERP